MNEYGAWFACVLYNCMVKTVVCALSLRDFCVLAVFLSQDVVWFVELVERKKDSAQGFTKALEDQEE